MSKWYVVWNGRKPGIYTTWAECQAQVNGFKGAMFKSFPSLNEAKEAFGGSSESKPQAISSKVIVPSISVDAACSGNPGVMEYRAVWTESGEVIFHEGPFSLGTNNIGEFLALVQAIQLCIQNGWDFPIYSDSVNAMLWVRGKAAKSTLVRNAETEGLWQRMEQASVWLHANRVQNQMIKWDTPNWGEIPADFGRK